MRINTPKADFLLDKPVKVLDHGIVMPIDYLGGDISIVKGARTSYGKNEDFNNDEKNKKLIFRLMKDQHTSPFELVEVVFQLELPIFVMRQLVRHRTFNLNEMSGRYVELPTDFYMPNDDKINTQAKTNKQGRSEETFSDMELHYTREAFYDSYNVSSSKYQYLLKQNVAKELARIVLPVSTYTKCVIKCDLRNIFNFLKLRLDAHAQYEIRVFAEAMVPFVQAVAPMAYSAFEEYVLYSKTYSRSELAKMNG